MTPLGQRALVIYSLIAVLALMLISLKDVSKGGKGRRVVALTPVIILLLNLL